MDTRMSPARYGGNTRKALAPRSVPAAALVARCRGQRPVHHDQVPARCRGHRLGHYGQVPATHNERRRRGQRPGYHDQVPREPKCGRGQPLGQGPLPTTTTQRLLTNSADPPCGVAAFVVNSEPRSGARSSVRMCVWGSSLLAVFIDHRDFGARAARPLCLSSPVDPHAGKYSDSL